VRGARPVSVLAVGWDVPRPDQSAGDLRYFSLLRLLTAEHRVSFFARCTSSSEEATRSRKQLERWGVKFVAGPVEAVLSRETYDVVLAEFHGTAASIWRQMRAWQPRARLVVDSVDVPRATWLDEGAASRGGLAHPPRCQARARLRVGQRPRPKRSVDAVTVAQQMRVAIEPRRQAAFEPRLGGSRLPAVEPVRMRRVAGGS
jgi:hypothetical protein